MRTAVPAILLGLGICPVAAMAAETADGTARPAIEAASTGEQIEEVVVSARKRQEKLQDVPVAETSLGARELERDNLTSLGTIQSKLPAFSFVSSNPKQTNVGIRGIGNNGQNSDGIDPSVGVFVDGVYAGRLGTVNNDFNDLASIEYLRGPQGTLFGKNTTGGVIQFNSQKPSFTPEADGIVTLGNYSDREFKANVSGPVVDDNLALRASAYYKTRDGFISNLNDDRTFQGQGGRGGRVQALAAPTDDVSIRVIASHDEQSYHTGGATFLSVVPGASSNLQSRMAARGLTLQGNPFDRTVNLDQDPHSDTRTTTATTLIDWETSYGTLSSVTGFRHWYFIPYNDQDATQLNAISDYGTDNDVTNLSQELRWASPKGSALDSVVGVYVASQDLKAHNRQTLGPDYWLYANKAANTAAQYKGLQTGDDYTLKDETEALFGHSSWHATDKLSFNAGLRQTWEHKSMNYLGYVTANPGKATQAQIDGAVTAGNIGSASGAVDDSSLGGQFGTSYKITDAVLTYAEVSRGHKAKGLNPNTLTTAQLTYGATQSVAGERADSVEIGTKSEWLDKRLLVNVAAYETIVKNYQNTAAYYAAALSASPTSVLTNVGYVRSKGLEIEATAVPVTGLRINGFLSPNQATYASYRSAPCSQAALNLRPTATCDLTGQQVPWTPKWTSDINAEYSHEIINGVVGYIVADYNWRSAQNLALTLDPLTEQSAYGIVNLRFGVRLFEEAVDLSFFVNNLFNQNYYIAMSAGTNGQQIVTGTPGDPLTFGSTLHVRF
ncbi:MAG: TonB-dependent receptor [Alphaproteobacteria bacterium]|nr:TonB-dependent receptor [Alphaproteobacteria bacterium]